MVEKLVIGTNSKRKFANKTMRRKTFLPFLVFVQDNNMSNQILTLFNVFLILNINPVINK